MSDEPMNLNADGKPIGTERNESDPMNQVNMSEPRVIPDGRLCPHCGGTDTFIQEDVNRFWGYGDLFSGCRTCFTAFAPPD